jgi:Flp pilus assembly protein TadD
VIEEFMTYEALTATIHDIVFAAMSEIVAALPQSQEWASESKSATAAGDRLKAARAARNTP